MENVRSFRPHVTPTSSSGLIRRVACFLAMFALSADLAFSAAAGRIVVQTVPAGATVYLDGQPNGKSPAAIEGLAPGRYFVRVELTGYRPVDLLVDLASGQKYQSPTLELVSESAPAAPAAAAPPRPAPTATPSPAPSAVNDRPLEAGGFPSSAGSVVPVPPAALVRATPPPAVAATPIPVAVVPAPPAVASAAPPAPAPAAGEPPTPADAAVQTAVNDYLNAIADGDVDGYVQLCAPAVEFYEDGTKTPAAIRKIRQQFKERWPVYKIENVRDGKIGAGDKPGVKRASVTYDWSVSNPKTGKKSSGTATDLLDFREMKGKWLLVRARQAVDRGRR